MNGNVGTVAAPLQGTLTRSLLKQPALDSFAFGPVAPRGS